MPIESKLTAVDSQGEHLFILAPEWEHLTQLMQTVIKQPEFVAKARLAGPRFVAENFTWKHAVDKLLDVVLPYNNINKIEYSTFEPIIL